VGLPPGINGCDALVDFQLIMPDGSIRHRVSNQSAASGLVPKKGLVYLATALVRFGFEQNDPPGEYRITATIREPAVGIVLRLNERVRFVK
jgi:hypothetical protein